MTNQLKSLSFLSLLITPILTTFSSGFWYNLAALSITKIYLHVAYDFDATSVFKPFSSFISQIHKPDMSWLDKIYILPTITIFRHYLIIHTSVLNAIALSSPHQGLSLSFLSSPYIIFIMA